MNLKDDFETMTRRLVDAIVEYQRTREFHAVMEVHDALKAIRQETSRLTDGRV